MAQGQKIHPQVQWVVIQLSKLQKNNQITTCLDLLTCSVRQVLLHFSVHETIPYLDEEALAEKHKGKSHLQDVDVDFLLGIVQKTPDLYLPVDELQEMLAVSCGTNFSHTMVW
ncbi:hypothetical protein SCLCIDRAFT_126096 [Scleroderma citrinum Foug A]|uniref:Uncharacterized protein n=1 Tax=Scleroderma citrinum Foug A TaxID=1036808 RepID=A0A0C3A477_9AGAM|nr:hypothetical protein SCLCIDRAFT_126096 [Scleroderma citrinum Foug A]